MKRSTKSAAARKDALLDTRADGVHTLQRQAVKELGVTTVQWAFLPYRIRTLGAESR